jgi:transposase
MSRAFAQALKFYGTLYDIEREVLDLQSEARRDIRQAACPASRRRSATVVARATAELVPDGSVTAKAIDYTLWNGVRS